MIDALEYVMVRPLAQALALALEHGYCDDIVDSMLLLRSESDGACFAEVHRNPATPVSRSNLISRVAIV